MVLLLSEKRGQRGTSMVWGYVLGAVLLLIAPFASLAASVDLSVDSQSIMFEPSIPMVGSPLRIYVTVKNDGAQDTEGIVVLSVDGRKELQRSLLVRKEGGSGTIWFDWTPDRGGDLLFRVVVFGRGEDIQPSNNRAEITQFVDEDTDRDGAPNRSDLDDDNDGMPDSFEERFGLNTTIADAYQDTDRDGLTNLEEYKAGTTPTVADTDGDAVVDGKDVFPLDPKEWKDTDHDGIGDNKDSTPIGNKPKVVQQVVRLAEPRPEIPEPWKKNLSVVVGSLLLLPLCVILWKVLRSPTKY